jgi:hypothetical protein
VIRVVHPADELTDEELLKAALDSGAFDSWNDPAEDIYTLEDGEPV